MCLAIPGKIVEITGQLDDTFRNGKVSFGGINKQVNLRMVPEANVGDYVLVHVGFAIRRIPQEQIEETLDLYNQLIAAASQDLMAADIQAEVAATAGVNGGARER